MVTASIDARSDAVSQGKRAYDGADELEDSHRSSETFAEAAQ
jgi:hypothetical protein